MPEMNVGAPGLQPSKAEAIARWEALLRDKQALLAKPGAHHKALLQQAHALHLANVISKEELSDLLEHADGALAFAMEALIDCESSD